MVYEIMLIIGIPVLIVLWRVLNAFMGKRIRAAYNRVQTDHRRKKNPCYRCPKPRKYVCDGCYVKIRKEYEHERK